MIILYLLGDHGLEPLPLLPYLLRDHGPEPLRPWTTGGISYSTLNPASLGGGGRPTELNVEMN